MNVFKKISLALAALLAITTASYAQTEGALNVSWGAAYPDPGTFLVGDSGGTALDSSSMAVFGVFAPTFDLEANKYNSAELFANFIVIGTSTVGLTEGGVTLPDGYIDGAVSGYNVDDTGIVGYKAYLWVLEGTTDYDLTSVLAVSDYAILSSSTWNTVPNGNDGFQSSNPEYDTHATSLDQVVVGSTLAGQGFNGGDMYTTAPVPEPAFYAAGLGVIALLVVQLHRRRKVA